MYDRVNNTSTEAVKKATGKNWKEWITLLDAAGLQKATHKEIVQYIWDNHMQNAWWVQMVTVGYEKTKGLREDHSSGEGFQIGASKTLPITIGQLYDFWIDEDKRKKWLPESFTITKSTENKSIRILWSDGKTRVDVGFYDKGNSKSQVAVNHSKIPTEKEAEKLQTFWKEKVALMAEVV